MSARKKNKTTSVSLRLIPPQVFVLAFFASKSHNC